MAASFGRSVDRLFRRLFFAGRRPGLQAGKERIQHRVGKEIRDGDHFLAGEPGTVGQLLLAHDQGCIGRDLPDCAVRALDILQTRFHQPRLETGDAEGAGAHAGVTGEDNLPDIAKRAPCDTEGAGKIPCRRGRGPFALALEVRTGLHHRD